MKSLKTNGDSQRFNNSSSAILIMLLHDALYEKYAEGYLTSHCLGAVKYTRVGQG
jgi:hypothetical protein